MTTTNACKDLPGAIAQSSTKLKAVMHRWHRALVGIRESLLSGDCRQRIDARRRDREAPGAQLTQVAGESPEPTRGDRPTGDAATRERALVPLPEERSQALAVLCDRLLHELDSAEADAAEIRFVVHKRDQPSHPRVNTGTEPGVGDGALVWELRRLIAWSGGTIAEVAQTLEDRGTGLSKTDRELLRDEVEALDIDLATLSALLADPIDWNGEFGSLLAGEVAPFDDISGDEDDQDRD